MSWLHRRKVINLGRAGPSKVGLTAVVTWGNKWAQGTHLHPPTCLPPLLLPPFPGLEKKERHGVEKKMWKRLVGCSNFQFREWEEQRLGHHQVTASGISTHSSIARGGKTESTAGATTHHVKGPSHLPSEPFWAVIAMHRHLPNQTASPLCCRHYPEWLRWQMGGGHVHSALRHLQYLLFCPPPAILLPPQALRDLGTALPRSLAHFFW